MQILNFILNQVPALTNSQSSNSEKNTNVKTTRRQQRFGKNVAQTRFGGEFWALYEVAYKASCPIFIYFLWILLIHDKLVECYQMHFDWDNETHWVRKYETGKDGVIAAMYRYLIYRERRSLECNGMNCHSKENLIHYSKKQSELVRIEHLWKVTTGMDGHGGVSQELRPKTPQPPLSEFKSQ